MHYKQPPIYKYGLMLILIYLFIKHQRIIPNDKILKNAVVISLMMIILDYIIIHKHPYPLENAHKKKKEKKIKKEDEHSENNNQEREMFDNQEPEFEMDRLLD
jgi:hypothetical protein